MTDRDLSTGGCGARWLRHHSETSRRLRSVVVLAPVSDIIDITPSAGDAPRETGRSYLLGLRCSIGTARTERTRETGTLQGGLTHLSKIELLEPAAVKELQSELGQLTGQPVLAISAVAAMGLKELLASVWQQLGIQT